MRIPLNILLELICMITGSHATITQVIAAVGVEYLFKCRQVGTEILDKLPMFVEPVAHQYNLVRMMKGNEKNSGEDDNCDGHVYNADNKAKLWVVGLYQDCKHERYARVLVRTKHSPTCVIDRHVQRGSVICTDYFSSYKDIEIEGYIHRSINHSKLYMDPVTGAHTMAIEVA